MVTLKIDTGLVHRRNRAGELLGYMSSAIDFYYVVCAVCRDLTKSGSLGCSCWGIGWRVCARRGCFFLKSLCAPSSVARMVWVSFREPHGPARDDT
jgi:hypothetical protein